MKKQLALAVSALGAYSPTFVTDDVPAIAIDFVGNYLVEFVGLAGLIALVVIAGFFLNRTKGLGVKFN